MNINLFCPKSILSTIHGIVQISLVDLNDREDMQRPTNTKAVRSLCVKPCSKLALLTSLGKKLPVVRTNAVELVKLLNLILPQSVNIRIFAVKFIYLCTSANNNGICVGHYGWVWVEQTQLWHKNLEKFGRCSVLTIISNLMNKRRL
ncbi:uncharacterized protein [Rutidosis leptorrhynchoides]|uniref:uncharacterized protein isoform X1 n=1 Tax=Rutidosis leptorrhynchoides TaxID=125765 RepID=UPI003A99809C